MKALIVGTRADQGLGNRLRPLVSGIRLSRRTGRSFSFVWQRHRHKSCGCFCNFDDLFLTETSILDTPRGIPEKAKVFNYRNHFAKGNPDLTPEHAFDVIDAHTPDETIFIESSWFVYDIGDVGRKQEAYREFGLQFAGLRPVACIADGVSRFTEDHLSAPALGIHMRMSPDYIRAWSRWTANVKTVATFPTCEEDFYPAIDEYLADSPSARLFLASDNDRSAEKVRARYGDRVLSYPVRTLDRNCVEGIQDALATIYLLNRCDLVLRARLSSFGEMGALLTRSELIERQHPSVSIANSKSMQKVRGP